MIAARHPATLACRACLAAALWPTALAAALAAVGGRLLAPAVEPGAASAAGTPWLLLPLLVAMGACTAAAVRLWPRFGRARPGADWIARLERGPMRGSGAIVAGALAAQFALTAPLTVVAARALGAPDRAAVHLRPVLPQLPVLGEPGQEVVAVLDPPVDLAEIHLRPRALPPGAPFVPSRLELRIDGERLSGPDPVFTEDRQRSSVRLDGRRVREVRLRLAAGTVPLWFDGEAIDCVAAAGRSALGNGILFAGLALLPTLLGLGLALLASSTAALPTVATVAGATLFVCTLGGVGPVDAAARWLLRGHWLPATGVFHASLPFLGGGCMAMILAMLPHRRPPR